jgi:hypothetical protein
LPTLERSIPRADETSVAMPLGEEVQRLSSFCNVVLAGAAAAAFGLSGTAQSAPTLVPTGYASTPNGGENVHIVLTSPSVDRDILAGGFTGTQTDLLFPSASTILFWCFQLDQFFSFGGTYTDYVATTVSDPAANLALAELFTEVFGGAPVSAPISDATSAAVQLAIWEIRYDTGNINGYHLNNGSFTATGGAGSLAAAQTLLDNLGLPSNQPTKYNITLLASPSSQDFITATPKPPFLTPEPSPLPLLGVGLAAMLFAMRRRIARQV